MRVLAKGNIFLEIGIVLMTGVLLWSLISPYREQKQQADLLRLTRSKIKTLHKLETLYFSVHNDFTVDAGKLVQFVMTAPPNVVPDTLFQPVKNAYRRWDNSVGIQDIQFNAFMDSLFYNPMTGEKFVVEIINKNDRKSFNIKPSLNDDDLRRWGGVQDGEITWDERAEIVR